MTQAVLQNQATNGRRTRDDAEQIIRAWHNSLPEKQVYTYDKYITDSTELTAKIADMCAYNETGIRFLFQAMPGGGKTHFVCKDLPQLIKAKTDNKKTIVIACPNNIQAHQNRRQYGTFAVAGDSSDKFNFNRINKIPYTAVYECVTALVNKPAAELKNCILIIDEAHQLLTEGDYRSFSGVMAAIDAVYSVGGVVCMMTATPRPIMYLMPYSAFIAAERKDAKKTNIRNIEYISVDTRKQIKAYDVMLDEIRAAKNAGHMAVVRYQSKEDIKKARKQLEAEGLTVEILTADCKEKAQDEDGNWYYKSQVYAGLIQHGTIPAAADCLLVTSVLEVGTSIIGVVNRGGEIVQDADLTPIFVCSRADTDIDKMLQFFARFRFPINQAKVICSKCQNPTQDPVDLSEGADAIAVKNAVNLYLRRDALATAFSKVRFRRLLKSWHGHIDGQGITADGKIDMPLIWADAVQRYFGLVYRQEGAAQVILKNEFGVPVVVRTEDKARKSKPNKSIKIPAEAKDAFRALVDSDSIFKVLASDDRDINADKSIASFKAAYPDYAKAMIEAIRPYARCEATMPDVIRRDLAIDAAIFNTQHPRTKYRYTDAKTEKENIINPATNLDFFYYEITQYPARIAEKILDAASGITTDLNVSDLDKMVYKADAWRITWNNRAFVHEIGGEKYDDFLTMWRIFRMLDNKARFDKFAQIAKKFVECDKEEARRARYAYTCVQLNRVEKRGLYADIACPDASYVAAEHKILTQPERYLYRAKQDEKGKIDSRYASKALWFEEDNDDGKPYADRFRKGAFVGKTLTAQDLKIIADGFGASITKMVGKAGIIGDKYSADDVYWMIRSAYTISCFKGREVVPAPETVKNMNEQDIKLKVRGLRLNLSESWMTAIMPDTTDAELEREKWANLYTAHTVTAETTETEVVAVTKKETPAKQIPFTPISYADDLQTKIEKYEQLLAMIDHDDDVRNQIWTIEEAYRLGHSILEDYMIFRQDIQGIVADFAYQGGYSHSKLIDILKTHGKNVT